MAVVASPRERLEQPGSAAAQPRPNWWLLGAIVLLGALLRFTTLDEQSFWFDEATTWTIVAHGLGHVLSQVPKTESTPPLYYVLLWLWSHVFGLGGAGLRSFSALCSTATIPVVWAIGRRLASERAGVIAALLTAVNPFLFWYAQEARSYSLLLLTSTVSLLMLVRAVQRPTTRRVLAWGISVAVALAAHYYAAVVIVPEAIWMLAVLHRRGMLDVRRVALGIGPVVVVGIALLPLLIHQNDGRASFIANSGSLPYRVAQLFKQDLIGEGQPEKGLLTAIASAAVIGAFALLWWRSRREERTAALLPLAIGAGGLVLAFVVAAVGTDYFNTRNLLPTWPALVLVVALGLGAARAGRAGEVATAVLVAVGLFCIFNVITNPRYQRQNWRGAAQRIGAQTGSRAIVADINSKVPLTPYMPRLSVYPSGGVGVREVDLIWLQRTTQWGPIPPFTPLPLPGFPSVSETKTSSYVVVRYRAPRPTLEPYAELNRLYPMQSRALTLLQSAR